MRSEWLIAGAVGVLVGSAMAGAAETGAQAGAGAANLETVRAIYAAFGRGDVPAILGHLSEEVEWEYGPVSTDVPWMQPRRGLQGVEEFFAALGALEFHRFEPERFLQDGDVVVVLVDLEATVKETGRRVVEDDEVHIWHFEDGKVSKFRHRADTHQHHLAYHDE